MFMDMPLHVFDPLLLHFRFPALTVSHFSEVQDDRVHTTAVQVLPIVSHCQSCDVSFVCCKGFNLKMKICSVKIKYVATFTQLLKYVMCPQFHTLRITFRLALLLILENVRKETESHRGTDLHSCAQYFRQIYIEFIKNI